MLQAAYRGHGRVSIAALICIQPGRRVRLIYRTRIYHHRKNEPKDFTVADFQALLQARAHPAGRSGLVGVGQPARARQRPDARVDRRSGGLVTGLPACAPELNPGEGIWSLLNRGVLANLAVCSLDHLIRVIKHGLKKIQYRPHPIDGCLAETGLLLKPP
ncbi:IS630 family transposase [Streptosporangium amethystogenes]|uniref:IS630 family transposase n=1 Tax=Streptosporangium amethystogenes TaxID=2002 RepID=UPI003791F793